MTNLLKKLRSRKVLLAIGGAMLVVAVGAIGLLVLFPEHRHTGAAQAAITEGAATGPETCSLYKDGSGIRITYEGQINESQCEKAAQSYSGGGSYWIAGTPPLIEGLQEVCALESPSGDLTAYVEDTGSAINGTAICGSLSHKGWTNDHTAPSEGPQERADNEATAEAQEEKGKAESEVRQQSETEQRRREHRQTGCELSVEAIERKEVARVKEEVKSGTLHKDEEDGREVGVEERGNAAIEKCEETGR